ncbi:MAG: epimerase [Chloroflexus sp.]|jgi:nucleoside-diphosphate-sugar epimerase|uniref:NAD-dependent epimerase/dehydratase family protein n=1 Tax=Chloroflexus sp. TaxID=1904827 RepID=UPI0021DD274A|nr:NAD(P)-dependent oxidoreductase [Chloroflexus sp.]GIV90754.1 MAG: epimerase [Chloroflexus sp.]
MTTTPTPHVLITGGAGYIGSLLTGVLLQHGWSVTVVDDLLFGGSSLLGYWYHPRFRFAKGDVCDPATLRAGADGIAVGDLPPARFDAVIHLAAIVGFPACQMVGPQVAWRYNFEGTKRVFAVADAAHVERFVFASTYSNYGLSPNGEPVTEDSPLNPQSLYAETKIAAEQYLRNDTGGAVTTPILFRFATLFGISPRTRFDLIVNQFVLEAMTKRKLIIYQRGYARSFVHVRDVCDAILLGLNAPLSTVNREIFNVGGDTGNYTKDEIVALVQRHVPGTVIEYKDLTFGGDMRDIRVSFAKIRERLGFVPRISVEQGIREVAGVLANGVIKDALDSQYRNAQFIVQ